MRHFFVAVSSFLIVMFWATYGLHAAIESGSLLAYLIGVGSNLIGCGMLGMIIGEWATFKRRDDLHGYIFRR